MIRFMIMFHEPWMYNQYRVGERAIYRGRYWDDCPQNPTEVEVIRTKKNRRGRISYVVKCQDSSEREVLLEQLIKIK